MAFLVCFKKIWEEPHGELIPFCLIYACLDHWLLYITSFAVTKLILHFITRRAAAGWLKSRRRFTFTGASPSDVLPRIFIPVLPSEFKYTNHLRMLPRQQIF